MSSHGGKFFVHRASDPADSKGTELGDAVNELASYVLIPSKILDVPGIVITDLIIGIGNTITEALSHVDPTEILPEISAEATLYAKTIGDLMRIPAAIASIPGNFVHEIAMLLGGRTGFDDSPLIPILHRYDPKNDGRFGRETKLSVTTVNTSALQGAIENGDLVLVDPQDAKNASNPVLTGDGIHYYTYTGNNSEESVFNKVGSPLAPADAQHLFDPEYGTVVDDDGSDKPAETKIYTSLDAKGTYSTTRQKSQKPGLGQPGNFTPGPVGADLYVQTDTGLVFAGDGMKMDPPETDPATGGLKGTGIKIYIPKEKPDADGNKWNTEINPLVNNPNMHTKDPTTGKVWHNRPIVTGFLSHQGADDPNNANDLHLPSGVSIVFFSIVPYRKPQDVPAGHLGFVSDQTLVAAYDKNGNLYPGFTPFTVTGSQLSAAWDPGQKSLILVGNKDSLTSSPRQMWKIPVTGEANLTNVTAALQTFNSTKSPQATGLNGDNRENQIYMVDGHPILISAFEGGLRVYASNTLDSLPNAQGVSVPNDRDQVNRGSSVRNLGPYGASATLTVDRSQNGVTQVHVHGIASYYQTLQDFEYSPAGDYYNMEVTFYPEPPAATPNNPSPPPTVTPPAPAPTSPDGGINPPPVPGPIPTGGDTNPPGPTSSPNPDPSAPTPGNPNLPTGGGAPTPVGDDPSHGNGP